MDCFGLLSSKIVESRCRRIKVAPHQLAEWLLEYFEGIAQISWPARTSMRSDSSPIDSGLAGGAAQALTGSCDCD